MCGITGAVWTDPRRQIDLSVLQQMTRVLSHRGPDDEGTRCSEFRLQPPYESQPGAALGFRRLSIIDLAGGHQPMPNEDESIWVVFNGEIYNFKALRQRLEGSRHRFRTHCDTEVIVHLYEDEGPDCFQHLNGMFAIAIWDAPRRQLVLGRDRLGQKPLIYRSEPGRLLFASELKSLLQVPGIPREIDPNAIDEYLTYQYVPYPNTIFKGFHKLPPGHRAVFRDGHLKIDAYWQPDFQRETAISYDAARQTLHDLLSDAVQLRMQSDVPLGAFLSGGIDSSIIVALMQQRATQPIKTFTIGFSEREYDESYYARQVAQHLGTDHHEFEVTPDAVSILPKLVWHFDEPFADSSAIPTWYVSELTRRHVVVALTGDGGDELFAGYPRYRAVAVSQWLDRITPVRSLLGARMWRALPASSRQKSPLRRFLRFQEVLNATPQRRYLEWIAIFNETRRAELYRDDFVARLGDSDPLQFLLRAWSRGATRDAVTAVSLADLVTYLPCDLMTKVDIASMAHSLECRQPFLDFRVVELAASLPVRWKYQRGRGKRMLQATFGHLLPPSIWKRPKMGFGVPLDHWFRKELRELAYETLLATDARCLEYFRREPIAEMLDQHASGRFNHPYRLWALLVLEKWLQMWVPAATPVPATP